MAEQKRKKLEVGVTPEGEARWVRLKEPNDYQGKLSWAANLIFSTAESEALRDKITAAANAKLDEVRAELERQAREGATGKDKAKARKALEEIRLQLPFTSIVDDEGYASDLWEFKFRSAVSYTDPKTGDTHDIMVPVYNRHNVQFNEKQADTPIIPNGSRVIIAYAIVPYYVSATGFVGVSLRLRAVQVREFASAFGDAKSFGFTADEVLPVSDEVEAGPPADAPPSAPASPPAEAPRDYGEFDDDIPF